MKSVKKGLEKGLFRNGFFRKILLTSTHLQVEVLNLQSGEEINLESHESKDQFIGFRGGKGKCTIEGHEFLVENGDVLLIPAGPGSEVTKFECHQTANINNNVFTSQESIGSMKKLRSGSMRI
jgi:mannose-6-phosphate isomerase-like protein (cupin superfamily)